MASAIAQRFAPQLPGFVAALGDAKVVSTIDDVRSALDQKPPVPVIGTHDGTFHCDEALACSMLKMLPAYKEAVIVRSRDPEILGLCNIVVDVGAVYDAENHRYDHHQRDFDGTMSELGHTTKLSSAGLVYRHFGLEVLQRLTEEQGKAAGTGAGYTSSEKPPQAPASGVAVAVDLEALRRKVYKGFIEHIDGIDNGVEAFGGSRNYDVTSTMSDRVSSLNPRWNQPSDNADANARFCAALQLTGTEFATVVEGYASSWWPARALVAAALDNAAALHPSRQILELASHCPWSSHLFQLEEERAAAGDSIVAGAAKYVLFPDSKGGWRIQAVPVEESSFSSRRGLPEPWRGVRDQKLSDLSGIEGCVFVHAGGFIGGNATREGAVAMALKAIAE